MLQQRDGAKTKPPAKGEPMTDLIEDLLHQLTLERLEDNLFRGQSRDLGGKSVFGGQVLGQAIRELRRRVPPRFEVEARDFLQVHRKGGRPCPRCGTTISEISPGGFVTSFCRGCQR